MFELILILILVTIVFGYTPYLTIKNIYYIFRQKGKKREQLQRADDFIIRQEKRHQNRQKKLERQKQENIEKEKEHRKNMLEKAVQLVDKNQFERAIIIFKEFGKRKHIISTLEKQAQVREKALDYDNAIRIWEQLGKIDEAARVRKLKAKQISIRVAQNVIHGDTIVKDSVLNRANVGSGAKSKAEQIKNIKELLDSDAIDENEFKQMKKEILGK